MVGSGAPPPAWYPDPGRRHEYRWWDGSRWTEHVSNRGIVGRDPLPPRPPVPARASGPPRQPPGPRAPAPAAPAGAPGPVVSAGVVPTAGVIPVGEARFEPGAWLEAYSVFLRRSAGMERGMPMSFDVRD